MGKFSFQYGRVEFRAKLSRGDWLWPALWLLPEKSGPEGGEGDPYGEWPASGEIDIMESRGNSHTYRDIWGDPAGRNAACSTLHYGKTEHLPDGSKALADGWRNAHYNMVVDPEYDFTQAFHTFGLYWAEDALYTYVIFPNGTESKMLDLSGGFKNGFFKSPLGGNTGKPGEEGWDKVTDNPYEGHPLSAPFNQKFYLIMNVAIGGDWWWDYAPWKACGRSEECTYINKFWDVRDQWYPTWLEAGEDSALQVDWVRVWQ
eukprot:CAMPEP_0113942060 /NCGR_PEP_ID=MMETSP1339-20121228/7835_1 /TAXON_ID=94617 /ORGANISM="Fibrocapsa japonica" /LENGTH=258 /DNA_ID=CAMNT_0000946369 /DNA_START=555 /DNA_END=1331 /DNA_ORIENTATION=+ /assembly_acc=CAM_ASM_000762